MCAGPGGPPTYGHSEADIQYGGSILCSTLDRNGGWSQWRCGKGLVPSGFVFVGYGLYKRHAWWVWDGGSDDRFSEGGREGGYEAFDRVGMIGDKRDTDG